MYGPIGLCCISLRQKSVAVSEHQIWGLFAELAPVSKVLIFEREPALKCFVEFGDTKSFEWALRNVERISQEFGKVSLYHSKKETLKNAVEFPTTPHPPHPPKSALPCPETSDPASFNSEDPARHLSHEAPACLTSRCKESLSATNTHSHLTDPTPAIDLEDSSLPPVTQADLSQCELAQISFPPRSSDELKPPEGAVVLVEGFHLPPKHVRLLQNIIGCFGNLIRMVANFELHRYFVEMENAHQASLVSIYLNQVNFFDSLLAIRLCPPCTLLPSPPKSKGLAFFQLEEKTHRFKKHLPIKFNPPSRTLHFTSLSPEVDHLVLFDLVNQVHEPLFIYKLFKTSGQSSMYLVELASVGHSLEVLAALHNKTVGAKSVKISFSHPEIT